ncbi:Uncharacterized conserved protein YbbK, DUF523 family [Paenibacillus sophorae]|uniref:DUF523 domain-containing protein n=1 Tax=Paenibacillus sophorae TaxID=1333845 RepID=A0A1H8RM06_9BACL|nr:DUF523 domain-containing protein [Paenibacillus sophorae]QWU17064.1 DUF523 domain-containing protein [Paenibacillus sophorae]SEO67425.1 Uncharacterized conserved protein YbbK, DUF523 family [Paenibacillus sophorae]
MIIVSSCLAGVECRYDGSHNVLDKIQKLARENKAVLVCPEVLGGCPTPREPAEIVGGTGEDVLAGNAKVIDRSGREVTGLFIEGAYKALETARKHNASLIVLKENSPSCGSQMIYDGRFAGNKIPGEGVTVALLRREGFKVISEKEFASGEFDAQ